MLTHSRGPLTKLATLATATGAVMAMTAVSAAPAEAHDGGGGHRGHHRAGYSVTLTEAVSASLDESGAVLAATDGASVRRDADDLIVLTFGRGGRPRSDEGPRAEHRGSSGSARSLSGGFTVTDVATTSWTGFVVDTAAGIVTADVDSAEDVAVFTIVPVATTGTDHSTTSAPSKARRRDNAPGSTRWQSTALELTEAGATALDGALGADTFSVGDVFATTTDGRGCGR